MDFTVPYPSPAITGRNCDTTSPNIRKPEKDRTFLIFLVVFSPKVIAKESSADRKQSNTYLCVDEDMRLRLEAKLIHSIVTGFKVLPV